MPGRTCATPAKREHVRDRRKRSAVGMTNINKTVVVLGATGQQGGSVAAALRADGWAVRAVVREPSGHRAHVLSASGVDTVHGDLGDPQSLRAAFSDAYGVFSVQPNSAQTGAAVTNQDEVRFGTAGPASPSAAASPPSSTARRSPRARQRASTTSTPRAVQRPMSGTWTSPAPSFGRPRSWSSW